MEKDRTYYHKKYYRIKTMAKLRQRIRVLEETIKDFIDSEEGIAYRNRKSKEYQKEYREKNKERIKRYQEEYKKL
tara:strand:+ start:253 stop:477 length:225 start_codon:yes stop_codon:yes gene_type:complete